MRSIDLSQFARLGVHKRPRAMTVVLEPAPGPTLSEQESVARAGVEAELAAHRSHRDEAAVAVRWYGGGYVVVGVAGPLDRRAAGQLGVLLCELRPQCTRGLLMTFARLGRWDPHLARVLGQTCIRCLVDGALVELLGVPPGLLDELCDLPVTAAPDLYGSVTFPAPGKSPASSVSNRHEMGVPAGCPDGPPTDRVPAPRTRPGRVRRAPR